jgi:hypothetical protein
MDDLLLGVTWCGVSALVVSMATLIIVGLH